MKNKFFYGLIFVLIGIILLYFFYLKVIKKENFIYIGNYGFLIVLSESMNPTIEKSELIVIKKFHKYELNDIVTYKNSENLPITHRIIEIDKENFVAKGDNNRISDEPIDLDNIYGKVIYNSKALGIFILYYLKTTILGIFCIILFCYVKKLIYEGEENEEKS